MSGFADRILGLHGWVAFTIVFLLPALEASAFVGFLFPGEIAVLLGGVLAFQGRISLPAAIAAAVLGAVIGDTLGYFVSHRWRFKDLKQGLCIGDRMSEHRGWGLRDAMVTIAWVTRPGSAR